MNVDFTEKKYRELLISLKLREYLFRTFLDYRSNIKEGSTIILRHDVDRLPGNALKMAELEAQLGIKGSYYFRIVPESYDPEIIKKIAKLGHEIGYHYEDVDLASKKIKVKNQKDVIEELIDAAWESFKSNLEKMRKVYPVKTICMHGSPLSKFDNKLIWSKYNYKDLDLIGEPYYDIDFNEFAYFTDTGRRWNGNTVSIRDKVESKFNFNFKTTKDIINNIQQLPPKLLLTIHPERWNDKFIPWVRQAVMQNAKNVVKRVIVSS